MIFMSSLPSYIMTWSARYIAQCLYESGRVVIDDDDEEEEDNDHY